MPSFSKAWVISGIIILATVTASAGQTPSRFVSSRGQQLVSGQGSPLLLKGINLGNWLVPEGYMFKFKNTNSPRLISTMLNQLVGEEEASRFWKTYRANYITREDISFIKQAGFNSVRVPFSYRLLVTEGGSPRFAGEGYQLLDNVVAWCRSEQLYVILDMHAAPGGQTGDNIDDGWGYPYLFESPEAQALTVNLWRRLAARYRNEPTVIGYDLLNEPIAHYFDIASLNPRLEALYRRIVAGIRTVDRNHLIFLGGAQWDTNFKVFGPPFDSRVVYTFHKYWMEVNQAAIQDYVDFRNEHGVPVWMGESGENTDAWIRSFRMLLEQNNIGWCFWPYKKLDATSSVVSINPPADWNTIVGFAEGPRSTFEEVRTHRPSPAQARKILNDYLARIRFANCRINDKYLAALGLREKRAPGRKGK